MIKFGEYLPDFPPLENPGATVAENVIPGDTAYLPMPSPVEYSDAINDRAQGGYSARDPSAVGTVYNFVGTSDKLYVLDTAGTSWTDVSRVSGYTTAADDLWEFAQWGNQVVSTNFTDEMQVITLGSPPFADLGGTPPKARHIATVSNFLVTGNTWDASDLYQPQRVRWSALNDITSWTVSGTTQAGFNDLRNDGGFIQRIIGGDYGLIFQERTITRMTYIGSPLVFQFDEVEKQRGALAPGSVIKIGGNVAYLAEDGFFIFDGQRSIPIGAGKVDDTFFNEVDYNYFSRMTVNLLPQEQVICWLYATVDADPVGTPNKMLMYNYAPNAINRWSYADITGFLLLSPLSQGYTLDGLDAVSTDLDALPFSLDSPVWVGSLNLLGVVNENNILAYFNGAAMDAVIETGEVQLNPPQRTNITLVRPYVDNYSVSASSGTITVQIATRDTLDQTVSFAAAVSLNSSGFAPVRSNGRFHRARVNITGGFVLAQGIDVINSSTAGKR